VLTIRDLAWTAGFLEGEATFRLRVNTNRATGRSGGTNEISVPQNERAPLDRLRLLYGGNITARPERRQRHHISKPSYVWTLSGIAARGLMMTLYPLIANPAKLAQIRTALDQWRTRPGTGIRNRAKTACPKGHPYDTLILLKGGKQTRRCRQCYNASMRAFMARRRGSA